MTAEFVVEGSELRLHCEARCDEPTPVNLTWHLYFNLSGEPGRDVGEQLLRIPAADTITAGCSTSNAIAMPSCIRLTAASR